MPARGDAQKLPPVIERFVKALVVCTKAVALYPPSSNIPLDTAKDVAAALREALQERPELHFAVSKAGLFYEGTPVFPDNAAYDNFARELYNRKLADMRFHSGVTPLDIVAFLSLLKYTPEELFSAGGFEGRLWELGVSSITVTEASISLIDASTDGEAGEPLGTMTPKQVDDLLASAYGGRPRDQVTVARFLGDKGAVATYLSEALAAGSDAAGAMDAGERFAELAEIAYEVGGDEGRHKMLRTLAEAFNELDPEIRRSLLVDGLLPEARTSEAVASVIRQMDIDEICRMLVDGMDDSPASREGLARAIRTLALISAADREEIISATGAAMRGAGMGESAVNEMVEMAAPSRITVRNRPSGGPGSERPADAIFRLLDMAPTPRLASGDDDAELEAVQEEARRGVTDGDVIMALVSLVALDAREHQFASTMAMLEDSLDLLIERGEIDIAADAADALAAAAERPDIDEQQSDRLRTAIGRFTKPADIRLIAHALRLYRPGTVEHEAARRLLDALGGQAIDPLLEQLADEPDMAVRKSIVDVLSELAPTYIDELGHHMSDPRWYVVRNVVAILGSTHSSGVLPYLERTLRHPEPRVRREAIRAFSCIPDRLSQEMLVAALSDDDGQNVQLAARYLASGGVRAAAPALEQVARGEGRGNRDTGARVEAIESLGRLGATESLPTLESLAGKRSLISASRARELRAAAESAIARIKAMRGGAR